MTRGATESGISRKLRYRNLSKFYYIFSMIKNNLNFKFRRFSLNIGRKSILGRFARVWHSVVVCVNQKIHPKIYLPIAIKTGNRLGFPSELQTKTSKPNSPRLPKQIFWDGPQKNFIWSFGIFSHATPYASKWHPYVKSENPSQNNILESS